MSDDKIELLMLEQFRIIRQPYARVLSGGSTGGWIALALQIFYPDFFGGAFSLCPDPVDFRYFQAVDIYKDKNAYFKEFGWVRVPTPSDRSTDGVTRLTYQQRNHMELAMGTKNRSGEQVDIFVSLITKSVPPICTKSVPLYIVNFSGSKPGSTCTEWTYTSP